VDRTLAVLEGRLRLTIEGRAAVELTPETAPAIFPGDAAVQADVLEGPVLDLNLMSRRGSARTSLARVGAGQDVAGPALVLAVGPVRLAASGATYQLGPYDALLVEPPEPPLRLEGGEGAWAYVASFEDVSRS
jgi:environmental stress-induced protein Ves